MIIKLFIFLLTAFVSGADPTLDKFMGGGNMMRTPYESYGGYVEEFMSMQCYMKEGKIYVDTDSVMRYPENESVRHAGIGYMTSGIAKIYDKQVMTLPGGFRLPISFVKETREYYSLDTTLLNQQTDFMWAQKSQMEYLQSQMIAGKILSYEGEGQCVDNIYCFLGKYFCQEMIGQYKLEEIITKDE